MSLEFPGKGNKAICFAAHSRHYHYDLMTTRLKFRYATGDILNALSTADRCTAVFLDNKCHDDNASIIIRTIILLPAKASCMLDQFNAVNSRNQELSMIIGVLLPDFTSLVERKPGNR